MELSDMDNVEDLRTLAAIDSVEDRIHMDDVYDPSVTDEAYEMEGKYGPRKKRPRIR